MLNETKKTKWVENLCIENNNVENKTGILYNDTVEKLKGRDVAQLGSAFVLGTKCHGFKSCHPYFLLFKRQKSSNEGSVEIDSKQKRILFFTLRSYLESALSSVR